MPAIENGSYGDTIINLNKFDFYGLVTEKSMIDNFNSTCSKLIVTAAPEAKKKYNTIKEVEIKPMQKDLDLSF